MVTRVRYTVHENGIQSMWLPSGQIGTYVRNRVSNQITRKMITWAIRNRRTGTLEKSFRTRSVTRRFQVAFKIESTARHGLWLERGTRPQTHVILYKDLGVRDADGNLVAGGVVGANRARANPRWHRYIGVYRARVRGIRPRRFMSNALRETLRENRLV